MAKTAHGSYENIELKNRYSLDENDLDSPGTAVSRSLLQTDSDRENTSHAGTMQHIDVEAAPSTRKRATPIPKLQMLTLCAVRIVDPISFTQLFPYVNEMMRDLHVTDQDSRIGFYSGLVDSMFSVSQLLSIYHWGKLSDRIGRRPVIFASTFGIALCTTWFGLSRTLWSALAARCIAGLLAGNIAVIHSTLGELSDETNQSIIFPIYGLVWPLGGIIGPLIGGTFSHPDIHWPQYFDNEWFRQHPYFLPCFIASSLAFISASFGMRFLEETHPYMRASRRQHQQQQQQHITSEKSSKEPQAIIPKIATSTRSAPPSTANIKKLLSNPLIRALCLSGGCLAFLASAFDVVYVLFCFSPIASGGLARPADEIGYSLAVSGLTSAGLQLFIMPWLLRTFNLDNMYRRCLSLFPLAFAGLPLLNYIARMGVDESGTVVVPWVKTATWAGTVLILAMSRVAVLAFSFSLMLLKDAAPSPEALGSTNGLAQWFQCLMRSFSPAFVSSLFAISIDNNLLGGHLWVVIMCSLATFGYYITSKIPEARARVNRLHGL
ncbi:hypothetical protein Clacol_002466 [Clathrus columnatus]|uniref:Major facilitator superfamily (MFS) profile domain-containing protein n=1 Tax=Clathrus columnatus TaxID=1419009 RepID=A0AAV5A6T7_9AGAM|nr:hypothetical protein Clacol_002466 [Clathrus columnatus]